MTVCIFLRVAIALVVGAYVSAVALSNGSAMAKKAEKKTPDECSGVSPVIAVPFLTPTY